MFRAIQSVLLLSSVSGVALRSSTGKTSPVACASAPSNPEDRRTIKSTLKVAEYNVDFLMVDPSKSGSLQCPGTGCDWPNVTIAMDHLSHVAEEIGNIDADIISLEEVRDCDILNRIIALIPNNLYKPYLVLGTDSATGQNTGLLTRIDPIADLTRSEARVSYPIPNSKCSGAVVDASAVGTSSTGVSKHYMTRFNIDGIAKPVTMIGLHFLAFPTDVNRCYEREAQATIIASMVSSAVAAGDEVIVLGDFNDFSDDIPDANNNVPISTVLKIIRDAGKLSNVASKAPQSERYTDWYDKDKDCIDHGVEEHSMIDHQLVSQNLFNRIENVTMLHNYEEKCLCLYSDHWPVITTFNLATSSEEMVTATI